MIENNSIYHGDVLEGLQKLPTDSIDLCFTSPPYYNARAYATYPTYEAYLSFLNDVTAEVVRVLKMSRIFVINLSCVLIAREKRSQESTRLPIPFDYMQIATRNGLKFVDDIIWQKPEATSGRRGATFEQFRRPVGYKPFQTTEYLLVFKKGENLLDGVIRSHSPEIITASLVEGEYERTNVWNLMPENVRRVKHPAPFPESLAERVIKYYSFVDDVVLDPFMGSGTTAVSAKKLKRNYIGIERSKEYIEITENRLKKINPHQ